MTKTTQSINPYNGETLAGYKGWDNERTDRAVKVAGEAFAQWSKFPISERATYFHKLASLLREEKEECARLITQEMGKLIHESKGEVDKCAWVCEYYADNAEQFLAPIDKPSDASKSYVRFDPTGVVFGIMPWNFPFWQAFRYIAPTLMAGNTTVMKHASNVWGCGEKIESLFQKAGFPDGAFQHVLIGSDQAERIIANPAVQGVTLTGSEPAGKSVASLAGKYLKKSVLELGGSDPFVVLSDASVEEAAATAVKARLLNAGQSCIAAKRFIVHKKVADDFLHCLISEVSHLKVGDPLNEQTNLAPMSREDLAEELEEQVNLSIQEGAKIVLGGGREGTHFSPYILTHAAPGMPAFDEELFGPVFPVAVVQDDEEALALANKTTFGLGASVWTQNAQLQEKAARMIESGAVFINSMVKSDPRLPFGGVKISGYGRELAEFGIREFTNIKTVYVD